MLLRRGVFEEVSFVACSGGNFDGKCGLPKGGLVGFVAC